MDLLFEKYRNRLLVTDTTFIRSSMDAIHWEYRLYGIKGARGVGKTTIMLQYLKENHLNDETALYVSLDNLWFAKNSLTSLTDHFVKRGGKHLFLDEVHKYPGWAQEIKNLYDDYPGLHIVFTGSSLLEILNSRADLSRRAIVYEMQGLSFREFLGMTTGKNFSIYSIDDILNNHIEISGDILGKIKPLQHFEKYLQYGYYPFFNEVKALYHQRIEELVNMILEIELPNLRGVENSHIPKIRKLIRIIAESVPFIPNISKLSERAGISRVTLLSYLVYLQEARLINSIYRDAEGITRLQKPDKIYMENTNIMYALSPGTLQKGTLRETFLINQLKYNNKVEYVEQGDLLLDERYTLEIGGKNKKNKQISSLPDAYIVADNIEFGTHNRIPLWLFGFLY
ncbi:MAG: AAA family ATPase [Bacteroidales bacterium]|nr:AAA family ATPase [Bacteroidales bacterium]